MNKIKKLRLEKGWTQKELAAKVNTVHQNIQRFETGKRALSQKWIKKLTQALECTADQLLEDGRGFCEPETSQYQIEGKLSDPSIEKIFNWRLYKIAMDAIEKFCKKKGISLEEEEAQGFIAKAYLRLKTGKKLDERALEIYYEDMVPPKIF